MKMRVEKLILSTSSLFLFAMLGLHAQTVKDIDGNVYKTITIGSQTWMAENLATTKFNNGDPISLTVENADWQMLDSLNSPGYAWYKNDKASHGTQYGALYNWYAVKTNKLCPAGWHIPTIEEWNNLSEYLGGENEAGNSLRATGTQHWLNFNSLSTNESGFTALPGGCRDQSGRFEGLGGFCYLWSASEFDSRTSWFVYLRSTDSQLHRGKWAKNSGYAVRCIMDLSKESATPAGAAGATRANTGDVKAVLGAYDVVKWTEVDNTSYNSFGPLNILNITASGPETVNIKVSFEGIQNSFAATNGMESSIGASNVLVKYSKIEETSFAIGNDPVWKYYFSMPGYESAYKLGNLKSIQGSYDPIQNELRLTGERHGFAGQMVIIAKKRK